MHFIFRPLVFLVLPGVIASAAIDRKLEKSFTVNPGALVKVDISGGAVASQIGAPGEVKLVLDQHFRSADTDAEANEILANYEIAVEQSGDEILLRVRSKKKWRWNSRSEMKPSAKIIVPADARLDLNTSGGSITVRGEMTSDVRCNTSGGSITVDGGTGSFDLDTSGGSISAGKALGALKADTSGGNIKVEYVGPSARRVDLDTSGGSISVGVDASGNFDLEADTSGGRVSVDGLAFSPTKKDRTHASGPINQGGHPLRADTSGGNITVKAATL
jgi:hypothetical protein